MDKGDFQWLARLRLEEAKALHAAGKYDGAYYLAGYAVECALKACIAKRTRAEEFPPKPKVVQDYYVHDLEKLIKAAQLEQPLQVRLQADARFNQNWTTVKLWNEDKRYESHTTEPIAQELIGAIEDPSHGVLPWLHSFW